MMTRLYSYVCALHVCVYSSTYCKDSGYTCDCYFLCSSEHFAKVQFATISITFVKATGQSNKLLRLASCVLLYVSLSLSVCLCLSLPLSPSFPVSLSPECVINDVAIDYVMDDVMTWVTIAS